MKKDKLDVNTLILEASVISFVAGYYYKVICRLFHYHYEPLNTILLYLLGILGILYFVLNYNKFSIIFRKINLGVDGIYPMKINRKKENGFIVYKFTLPAGLSTNEIEKKKPEIEQFLGKRIEVTYLYKRTFAIKVFNEY